VVELASSGQNRDLDSSVIRNEDFKIAVKDRNLHPIRQQFKTYNMHLIDKCRNTKEEKVTNISLTSNFGGKQEDLSEDEMNILQFLEVMTKFGYPVQSEIRTAAENIITTKKIPADTEKDGKKWRKQYFVYSENKVLMNICNRLTEEEVFIMYELLCQEEHEDFKPVRQQLLNLQVNVDDFKEKPGLKETAFFYFVIILISNKVLNRLYTHSLNNIFVLMKKKRDDDPRIDGLLDQVSRYPLASHPPGLCIIFNMEEMREGSCCDRRNVKELFENVFKYDVLEVNNPDKETVQSVISELKSPRNQFYDSLVVWFMSHGDKTYLHVKNDKIHRRLDLIQPITEIGWLFMKPKVFFIQACADRRRKDVVMPTATEKYKATATDGRSVLAKDTSTRWESTYGEYEDVYDINPFADTIVAYATKWYQKAARNDKGSLFVDTLVDQLREYGCKEPIESVLRRTHYNVNTVKLRTEEGKLRQAPYFESSLQKVFIFPTIDSH
ncbi:hypothetical protein OTU49_000624, partial [Cherax quadricarinatus]